ncbi:MAG: hypothetical protein ACTS2F_19140 [Thainema sp.]
MVSTENRLVDYLAQIQPQLLTLDDDTLAAASSKGLVRRAYKELSKLAAPELQVDDTNLQFTADDCTVTLSTSDLLNATCTCPAADTCRHILVAYLWLRSQLQDQNPTATSTPESINSQSTQPLTYTLEDLITWSGKPTLRDAFAFVQREPHQIEGQDPIVARFNNANITCRHFSATGLAGMLCSCKPRQVCLHQAAAVLAILRSQGTVLSLPDTSSDSDDTVVAAEAPQVIASAQTLLESIVALGLLHLSDISHQQFVTLAVSAQAAHLPRLSLALRGIATEIELQLKRDAEADCDRWFERMSRTYALCAALQQAAPNYPIYLAGQSQSRYDDAGTLHLIGLGAYPWQSQSGYGGLTIIFWDTAAQQWCSWSDSRPLFHQQSFNPRRIYQQSGPWDGIANPAEASQSYLQLYNARRNYQQRLSTSSQTTGTAIRPTSAADWQSIRCCFQDWNTLRQHIARTSPIGLTEASPLDRLAIIQPQHWGARQFDPVQQLFTWVLWDQQDQPLILRVRFASDASAVVELLEQLDATQEDGSGILGSIYLEKDQIFCHPIALCRQTDAGKPTILNLHFPSQQQTAAKSAEKAEKTESSDAQPNAIATDATELVPASADEETNPIAADPAIDFLIIALQRLAERGQHAFNLDHNRELLQSARHFEKVGMVTLAVAIQTLIQSPHKSAAHLLKLRYLCSLYQNS